MQRWSQWPAWTKRSALVLALAAVCGLATAVAGLADLHFADSG